MRNYSEQEVNVKKLQPENSIAFSMDLILYWWLVTVVIILRLCTVYLARFEKTFLNSLNLHLILRWNYFSGLCVWVLRCDCKHLSRFFEKCRIFHLKLAVPESRLFCMIPFLQARYPHRLPKIIKIMILQFFKCLTYFNFRECYGLCAISWRSSFSFFWHYSSV